MVRRTCRPGRDRTARRRARRSRPPWRARRWRARGKGHGDVAIVLRRESRSRRCDRATRAPASSRSAPSRRGEASACASSPGRPRNLAGAHDFFERVRSSLGWREPQPRVRRNASALSQTLAGRVRGSVRVAARLDLWGARPIAQARSFPLIFEFVFLTFGIARGDWSSGVGSSGGVRTRRLNLVVIFSFSRSSQEKPRPRAPPRIRRHFAPHRRHGAEEWQTYQDIERRRLQLAARCTHTGAARCVRG